MVPASKKFTALSTTDLKINVVVPGDRNRKSGLARGSGRMEEESGRASQKR